MIDNYSHINNTVFYISESIPGPQENSNEYSNLINNYNSQITHSCNCVVMCSQECVCIQLSKINDSTSQTSTYNKIKNLENSYILECNDLCTCTDKCPNRVIQRGPIKNLTIKNCAIEAKGYGLFTEMLIPKGTFICEYAGEIITKSEAEKRQSINRSRQKMNYIFCLNEIVYNKNIQTFIDPTVFGNIGRYINHSCTPNSVVVPVRINCPIPKLAIFSCSDIPPGSEITFHYGMDNLTSPTQSIQTDRKLCLCQSFQCSGLVPFNSY